MEIKYRPQRLGQNKYNELGEIVSLMLRMCKPILITGKAVVLGSEFSVAKGIKQLKSKCLYVEALIKKRR